MSSQQNNCYRYKCDGVILPSVSTILRSDPKFQQARKSRGASALQPGTARFGFAKQRGIEVHSAARKFIRTGEVDLSPKFYPYWEGIQKQLSLLDLTKVEWVEGPAIPELQHLRDGDNSAVWNLKQKYCGCPDLVANLGGLRTLVEFKTSDELHMATYDMNFKNYSSWWRHSQSRMQVGSYCTAYEMTTGRPIEAAAIVVATRDDSQLFIMERDAIDKATQKFHKLAKSFHLSDKFVQPLSSTQEKQPAVV